MAESKHTPGPWHWVIHDVSMASLGVGDDPGHGTPLVLSVSPCRSCAERAAGKEWEWGRCTTPSEANARLIAAAPELLEAVHALLSIADSGYQGAYDIIDAAKAVIAKAEGTS